VSLTASPLISFGAPEKSPYECPAMNKILTIEPLIDRDQLALVLGVNPQTISLMRRRKEIPTHQIPPPIVPYRVSDVLAALKKKEARCQKIIDHQWPKTIQAG